MRYTAAQKREAIDVATRVGVTEAANQLGMDKSTISRWATAAGVATVGNEQTRNATEAAKAKREALRTELHGLLLEKAVDMLRRMDEEHIDYRGKDADKVTFDKAPAGACQQYATSAAILIDKLRLELGQATQRHETVGSSREAVKEHIDELKQRRERKSA